MRAQPPARRRPPSPAAETAGEGRELEQLDSLAGGARPANRGSS